MKLRLLKWIAVSLVLGTLIVGWLYRAGDSIPAGVSESDYNRIVQKLQRSTHQVPTRDEVLFRLGNDYTTQKKWDAAAEAFAQVAPASPHGRDACYLRAQSVLQLDRLRESERLFREFLSDSSSTGQEWVTLPSHGDEVQARQFLSYLLSVELRFDERRELLIDLVKRGDAELFDVLARHFQSLMEWNNTHGVERLERSCSVSPDDWSLQATLAQYRVAQGRLEEAWQLLQTCREHAPNDWIVTIATLTCLEERNDWDGYMALAEQLSPVAEREPVELLRHRGRLALRQGQSSEAVKYYQQALSVDPAHVPCRMGLAQALASDPERRTRELAVVQSLVRIQNRLGWAASKAPTPEVLLEIAQLSFDAGLKEAATDVCAFASRMFHPSDRFDEFLKEHGLSSAAEVAQ